MNSNTRLLTCLKIFITLLFCLTSFIGFAKPTKIQFNTRNITQNIRQILKQAKPNTQIGIIVQSMKTGKIIYQKNANNLYTPASTLKLFTAAAGLYYLKPSFRFKTQLLTRGKIKQGVLHGNLTFKFGGDPNLTIANLNKMIKRLKKNGLRKIAGRIFIDNSDYNFVPYPPGWVWDDLSFAYAAPMNAIIINQNKYLLQITPNKVGQHPRLNPKLPKGVADYANYMITTGQYQKNCPIVIYSEANNHYTVSGCFDRRWGKQHRALAIRNIVKYTQVLLALLLKQNHIVFHGSIHVHPAAKGSYALITHYSQPLKKIIYNMLKDSNNLTTNSIFKKLGETYYNSQGTWQNSLRTLKKILAKPTGINFKKNLVNDGAGLSRYNLVTPRQMNKLLYFIYHNKTVFPALYKALPIAGVDGTLSSRMRSLMQGDRVHAKTGSMTGVTSLAGYARSKHNGMLSFVVMINHFVGKRKPYLQLENNICKALVNAKK